MSSIGEHLRKQLSKALQLKELPEVKFSWYIEVRNGLVYRSCIPLILSSHLAISSKIIAVDIAEYFRYSDDFNVQVSPKGCLDFVLTSSFVSQWLQCLLTISPLPTISPIKQNLTFEQLFPLHYAYSRCYILMGIATTQNLSPSIVWDLITLEELPLISKIAQTVDAFYTSDYINWWKSATKLTHAFLDYYDHNPLWCNNTSQARLAMISITKRLLTQLMEEGLQVTPLKHL